MRTTAFGVDYDRPRAFFFHYNKPLSKQKGKPQISIHFDGACHIADNVDCAVPCRGRLGRRQPFFVMAGKLRSFSMVGGTAYLR